jgi:hypothetical protein
MGTSCYKQWIDPFIPNETKLLLIEIEIYQAISVVS